MPHFISREGVWEAAKERVVDTQAPAGQEIYEGPDRAALEMLAANGGTLGQHYSVDAEMVMRSRQLGYKSVEEYLSAVGYNPAKAKKQFEVLSQQVVDHRDPERKPLTPQGITGGTDISGGGKSRLGGFEHPADAPGRKANS